MILQAAAADFDRILDVERALLARARLLLDIRNSSPPDRRNSAPPPPKPRGGPPALAGEKSEPVRLGSVITTHALFKSEVECKMTSGHRILHCASRPFDSSLSLSSRSPRPKAIGVLALLQRDKLCGFGNRVRYAQPRSRLKPEVRKRKTPSRGLRSASLLGPTHVQAAAAARAASAGRRLFHDRSVLRHARIADRICRRSCRSCKLQNQLNTRPGRWSQCRCWSRASV